MLWIETVWSLSVRLGFNLVIRRNSYTLCLTSLLLRRFVFRKVRVERLVMSHKGPWEGSFPSSFARARETSGYEADVFHNSIWISVCFRLHNKAQYSPINLKHLHEFKIYILSVPLKFLFFKTSINARNWLFEKWICSQSTQGHQIQVCISALNFTLQLLWPATENLSNFRWIIFLVWRHLYRMSRDWN